MKHPTFHYTTLFRSDVPQDLRIAVELEQQIDVGLREAAQEQAVCREHDLQSKRDDTKRRLPFPVCRGEGRGEGRGARGGRGRRRREGGGDSLLSPTLARHTRIGSG